MSALLDVGIFIFSFMTSGSRDPAREGWGAASADEPRGIASCGTFPVARAGVERGATSASGGAIAGEAPGRMATTGSKATGRAYAVTDSGIRALLSAAAATVLSADAAADESVHIGGWLAKM